MTKFDARRDVFNVAANKFEMLSEIESLEVSMQRLRVDARENSR